MADLVKEAMEPDIKDDPTESTDQAPSHTSPLPSNVEVNQPSIDMASESQPVADAEEAGGVTNNSPLQPQDIYANDSLPFEALQSSDLPLGTTTRTAEPDTTTESLEERTTAEEDVFMEVDQALTGDEQNTQRLDSEGYNADADVDPPSRSPSPARDISGSASLGGVGTYDDENERQAIRADSEGYVPELDIDPPSPEGDNDRANGGSVEFGNSDRFPDDGMESYNPEFDIDPPSLSPEGQQANGGSVSLSDYDMIDGGDMQGITRTNSDEPEIIHETTIPNDEADIKDEDMEDNHDTTPTPIQRPMSAARRLKIEHSQHSQHCRASTNPPTSLPGPSTTTPLTPLDALITSLRAQHTPWSTIVRAANTHLTSQNLDPIATIPFVYSRYVLSGHSIPGLKPESSPGPNGRFTSRSSTAIDDQTRLNTLLNSSRLGTPMDLDSNQRPRNPATLPTSATAKAAKRAASFRHEGVDGAGGGTNRFSARDDEVLVKVHRELKDRFWETVAERVSAGGGEKVFEADECERRYAAI